MKKITLLSLAAVAALASDSASIQKITVEGELPSNITAQDVETSRSTKMTGDTAKLIADVPGVSVYDMGSRASLPVIHGLADDRIKIDIDGMNITSACPNHMNPALSYIDSTKVDTIEVMAGITPVSEGGDSIAGTIKVQSKDPIFASNPSEVIVDGAVSGFYRSNSQARGASLDATVANDKISVNYSGFTEQADNYKNGNGDIVKDTLYRQANHAATFAYKNDDGYTALKLTQTYIDYMGFPNEYMDMLDNKSLSGNLIYKGKIGALLVDANAYLQNTDHFMNKIETERTGDMPMYTEAKESGVNLKFTLPYSAAQTFKFGADYNRYRLDDYWTAVAGKAGMSPGTFLNINNGERDRFGIFAEAHSQWSTKLSSILGLRYDRVMMDTDDVHGYNGYPGFTGANNNDPVDAAGFNALDHKKTDNNYDLTAVSKYEFNEKSDLELGFSRKTRSPNIYERYAWAGGYGTNPTSPSASPIRMDMAMVNWFGDGNGYVGNLELEPELAHTISATLSLHDSAQKDWGLKLTPYYSKVKDYIDVKSLGSVPVGTPMAMFTGVQMLQFVNTDAHLYGANLSGYSVLSNTVENGKVTLKGSLSYTKGSRDDGGSLYHLMPLHAKASLERVSGSWTNGIDVEMVNDKEDVDDIRHEPTTPGYTLVDLRLGYDWTKQFHMDFSVTNLFDKAYELPLGGIDMVNSGPASAYNPLQGMGRSFNAGLSYKF